MPSENSSISFAEYFSRTFTNPAKEIQGGVQLPSTENANNDKRLFFFSFGSGLVIVNILLLIWSNFDYALPVYDMAGHLLSGDNCRDLLAHAHPAHRYWWQALFAVNPLYPPFTYFVYGVFKLVLGPARWVELLVQHFFASVLYASTFYLAKIIFKSHAIALSAALLVFSFPLVFLLTHYDMLDLPGMGMVCLSLLCFTLWQDRPSLIVSIFLGISCALATLTKNNSVAFLMAPLLGSITLSLIQRDWKRIKFLFVTGLAGLTTLIPWLILAFRPMLQAVAVYQNNFESPFLQRLGYYLINFPSITSLFIFVLFILAAYISPRFIHKRMAFVNASALGGIFILSLLRWTEQVRYALPAAIPVALYCAWAAVSCFRNPKWRISCIITVSLIVFSFVENSFTPNPLPRINLPTPIASFFGIEPARTMAHHAPGGTSSYPTPQADWGYDWVFSTMKSNLSEQELAKAQQHILQFAIMPDCEEISSTSYSYLVQRNKMPVHPFTPRNNTLYGAGCSFNASLAKIINWYLLKTGSAVCPGSHFDSEASEKGYMQWCDFVRKSDLFKLMGTKNLPDGTQLELYKLVKNQ